HFSLRDLAAVRHIALPGAVVQMAVATALGIAVARLWSWTFGAGLVLGLALSVASTVVLLRALEAQGTLGSAQGRLAVGWLIVEDLVTVLTLVLLPAFSGALSGAPSDRTASTLPHLLVTVGLTFGKVAIFIVLMLLVGARLFPWLLAHVARTGS